MTDEKKPREWEIESFDHPDGNGEDTRWIYGPNTERVKVIEHAAYEKLQSEVELTQGRLEHFQKLHKEIYDKLQAAEAKYVQQIKEYAERANDDIQVLRDDARRLAEALVRSHNRYVQCEDCVARENIAREALTPEIRKKYLK